MPIMRIDGRFDPRVWVQPRKEELAQPEVAGFAQPAPELVLSVSAQHASDVDFATASDQGYAYTHASRIAERVTGMLEVTADV